MLSALDDVEMAFVASANGVQTHVHGKLSCLRPGVQSNMDSLSSGTTQVSALSVMDDALASAEGVNVERNDVSQLGEGVQIGSIDALRLIEDGENSFSPRNSDIQVCGQAIMELQAKHEVVLLQNRNAAPEISRLN